MFGNRSLIYSSKEKTKVMNKFIEENPFNAMKTLSSFKSTNNPLNTLSQRTTYMKTYNKTGMNSNKQNKKYQPFCTLNYEGRETYNINNLEFNLKAKRNKFLERHKKLTKELNEKEKEIDDLNDLIEETRLKNFNLDELIKAYAKKNSTNEIIKKEISDYIKRIRKITEGGNESLENFENTIKTLELENINYENEMKKKEEKINKEKKDLENLIKNKRDLLKRAENEYRESKRREASLKTHIEEQRTNYDRFKKNLVEKTKIIEDKINSVSKKVNSLNVKNNLIDELNNAKLSSNKKEYDILINNINTIDKESNEILNKNNNLKIKLNELKKEVKVNKSKKKK